MFRVLGNVFDLDGFDHSDIEDVRKEMPTVLEDIGKINDAIDVESDDVSNELIRFLGAGKVVDLIKLFEDQNHFNAHQIKKDTALKFIQKQLKNLALLTRGLVKSLKVRLKQTLNLF